MAWVPLDRFAAPVDPKFLTTWRDFEDRFEKPLAGIWLAGLLPGVDSTDSEHTPKADLQWENDDDDGLEQARAIEDAIKFTYETTSADHELNEAK